MEKMIDIDSLLIDREIQPRAELDVSHLYDLIDLLKDGVVLPPITVYDTGTELLVVDGFHRVTANRRLGKKEICIDLIAGSREEAILAAFRLNCSHGLLINKYDKCRFVRKVVSDPQYQSFSNRELANLLGVSHTLINNIKNKSSSPAPEKEKVSLASQIRQLTKEIGLLRVESNKWRQAYEDLLAQRTGMPLPAPQKVDPSSGITSYQEVASQLNLTLTELFIVINKDKEIRESTQESKGLTDSQIIRIKEIVCSTSKQSS